MTPPPDPVGHFCQQCGERLDDAKLAKHPEMCFCSRACAQAHRKAHPELYRAQREATAAANRARWEEWRAAGVDSAHGGEAAKKRGAKIAESDRQKPRRRKTSSKKPPD